MLGIPHIPTAQFCQSFALTMSQKRSELSFYIYIHARVCVCVYVYVMYMYFKLLVYWLKHIFEVLLAKYVSILVMLIVTLATGLNIHFRFYAFVKLIYPVTETICFQSPLEC